MTTIIKSIFGKELTVGESRTCPGKTALACEGHVRLYPTAELLDALNAEPKTVAEGLRAKLADAERGLDTTRELEAEIANWKSRAGHAESVIGNYLNSNLDLIARAEAAESKLARVEAICAEEYSAPEGGGAVMVSRDAILAALAGTPAFVLPTEAGAGITARDRTDDLVCREFRLFGNKRWYSTGGRKYTPEQVMSNFTGHRVIDGGE